MGIIDLTKENKMDNDVIKTEEKEKELRTDLVALQDFIIAKEVVLKDEMIGKIVMVNHSGNRKPYTEMEIIGVGPGAVNNVGQRGIIDLKVGDVVFMGPCAKLELDKVEKEKTTEILWGLKHYDCLAVKQ